jgi:hypothetical protein
MVDNLALLIAHIFLVVAILRSVRASGDARKTALKSWRGTDRA